MRLLASVPLAAAVAVATSLGVTGCSASGPIAAANAYIPAPTTPGDTVAYLQIRNNGRADELVAARTSAGGTVVLRAPVTRGTHVTAMRSVSEIPVPADSTLRLDPNSYHLLISGAGAMPSGKAITVTLTFAHAGTISVIALVTDPESGGSSYFLN
ncbi:MAG TPA: copper chaperone PCu(A)C [Streptosporangiaceae bacterium]|nr:copper chaperone PCu(A)C [Streptosporangiaceae bacterium]